VPRHEGYVEQPQKGPWGPVRRTVAEPQGGGRGRGCRLGIRRARSLRCVVQEFTSQPGAVPQLDAVAPCQLHGLLGEVAGGDDRRFVRSVVGFGSRYFLDNTDTHLACTSVLGLDCGLGAVPLEEKISPEVCAVRGEADPVALGPESRLKKLLKLLAVHVLQISQARMPQRSITPAAKKAKDNYRQPQDGEAHQEPHEKRIEPLPAEEERDEGDRVGCICEACRLSLSLFARLHHG